MHAVETCAERVLGYRFLFATVDRKARKLTELRTVIPAVKSLSVPKGLLIEDAPAFFHRVTNSRPRDLVGLREHHAPRTAWIEPFGELRFIDFDYADQVTIGAGRVYFGSRADHSIRTPDVGSRRGQWVFHTAGPPIRSCAVEVGPNERL